MSQSFSTPHSVPVYRAGLKYAAAHCYSRPNHEESCTLASRREFSLFRNNLKPGSVDRPGGFSGIPRIPITKSDISRMPIVAATLDIGFP